MFTGMQIKPVVVSQEDLDTLLKRLSVLDGEMVTGRRRRPAPGRQPARSRR